MTSLEFVSIIPPDNVLVVTAADELLVLLTGLVTLDTSRDTAKPEGMLATLVVITSVRELASQLLVPCTEPGSVNEIAGLPFMLQPSSGSTIVMDPPAGTAPVAVNETVTGLCTPGVLTLGLQVRAPVRLPALIASVEMFAGPSTTSPDELFVVTMAKPVGRTEGGVVKSPMLKNTKPPSEIGAPVVTVTVLVVGFHAALAFTVGGFVNAT